jgi:pimeloyl-ACP methyl ester carboxylesterase
MKKITKFLFFSVIVSVIILILIPVSTPSLFKSEEALKNLSESDFILIFNPGGWGNSAGEEAEDLLPIIQGIKDDLNEWGHKVAIIPYNRAQEGILNRLSATKDFLSGYSFSSDRFAAEVESLAKDFPNKKIILAGLSNGAAFINEAYGKLSKEIRESLCAISIGTPFWSDKVEAKNILFLDNNGKDTLAKGEVGPLFMAAIEAPFKWFFSKFTGEDVSLGKAFKAKGHTYSWASDTKNSITTFLEDNIR